MNFSTNSKNVKGFTQSDQKLANYTKTFIAWEILKKCLEDEDSHEWMKNQIGVFSSIKEYLHYWFLKISSDLKSREFSTDGGELSKIDNIQREILEMF